MGGKVSTGRDAVNTGQTIIDNIAVEYRLDKTASRYVNVFYDRNYESLLEGQVTKMGGGIVLRKKADKLGELFIFRNNTPSTPSPRSSTPFSSSSSSSPSSRPTTSSTSSNE